MVLGVESFFIRVSKATVRRQDYNFMDIYFQIKKIDLHINNRSFIEKKHYFMDINFQINKIDQHILQYGGYIKNIFTLQQNIFRKVYSVKSLFSEKFIQQYKSFHFPTQNKLFLKLDLVVWSQAQA